MKLGNKIWLKIERKNTFDNDTTTTEGEYIVTKISQELAYCFGDGMLSEGFNSFDYAIEDVDAPAPVKKGSIYVPTPQLLNDNEMNELHYDNKIVSWEVL